MTKQPYLPYSDSGRVIWINNFSLKKEEHASIFGFDPASVDQTKKDAAMWTFTVGTLDNIRTDSKQFTSFKNLLRNGPKGSGTEPFPTLSTLPAIPDLVPADIFERVSSDVNQIKNHNNYSEAFGSEFGIIGSPSVFDPANYKTTLKVRAYPGYVEVKFVKKGASGVNIYMRIKGQTQWIKKGTVVKSPFQDNTPLQTPGTAETREYMARGFKGNTEIGLNSDIVSIVFGG